MSGVVGELLLDGRVLVLVVTGSEEVGEREMHCCVVMAKRSMLGMMSFNRGCVVGRGVGMIVGEARR